MGNKIVTIDLTGDVRREFSLRLENNEALKNENYRKILKGYIRKPRKPVLEILLNGLAKLRL
jgi:hypothetical protein